MSAAAPENSSLDPKRKESDVYDRQIRLWGADAQAKMAKAQVLYIHCTGITSEVIKNLVLAGVRAAICDDRDYPDAVMNTPSLLLSGMVRDSIDTKDDNDSAQDPPAAKKVKASKTVAEALQPVIEEMNPLLGNCEIAPPLDQLTSDYLQKFSVIVASRLSMQQATDLAKKIDTKQTKLYCADTFGLFGACALDLGPDCQYRPEVGKKLLPPTTVPSENYLPLAKIYQVPLEKAINRFFKKAPPEPWVQYRCILHYVEHTNGVWPSQENAQDFSQVIAAWLKPTALCDHFTAQQLEDLAKVATAEVAPVCAVLGGMMGNEVIKVVSGKGEPANNTLLMDGKACKALTFLVKEKK